VKCILDTNVYLFAMSSDEGERFFAQRFLPILFCTYLSSVVVEELYAGALERSGRVVVPTFKDWKEVGKLVAQLSRKEPSHKPKVQQMLNDILIALCARQIGATLFTFNKVDFELICRYKPFSLEVLISQQKM